MTSEALILIGRGTTPARNAIETHAIRLERSDAVEEVHAATYEHEPIRELREQVAAIDADRVYAMPAFVSHTHDTIEELPRALAAAPGEVQYCEPLGGSSAVTDVLIDRATALVSAAEDASLVLVGFGSGSTPYQRRTAEYHAARIEAHTAYGEVRTCYLLQNPAVECVRYNVSNDRAVAVPLFFARSEATEKRIPAKLELDRGGLAYADPLGDHPRITDAIRAEIEKRRVLASGGGSPRSFEARLTQQARPVATDGEGMNGQ